jgi:hypothetical protein
MDGADRGNDRIVKLLTALVMLTSVLVLALAAGGALLWREYATLRGSLEREVAREVAVEVSRRQEAISAELVSVGREATRQIARFERRAAELRIEGGGPVDSAKRAIELTQLMADELLLQLKLMTTLEDALGNTARPLTLQRELLGSDGDGERPAGLNASSPSAPRTSGRRR